MPLALAVARLNATSGDIEQIASSLYPKTALIHTLKIIAASMASLLRDAFLSWEEEQELDWAVRYWEAARLAGLPVDEDFGEFYRALEWMGAQRHLKVAGIFARLRYRDGKAGYVEDTPRFIAYLRRVATRYTALAPLARLLDQLEDRAAQVGYTF